MEDGLAVKEALKDSDKQQVCVIGAGLYDSVFDAAPGPDKHVTIIEREQHILSRQFSPRSCGLRRAIRGIRCRP